MSRFFRTLALAAILGSATAKAGAPPDGAAQINGGLVAVLKQITPAVTYIETTGRVGIGGSSKTRRKVGRLATGVTAATARDESASGSGVVIDAGAGLIVTNNHVIHHAEKITVRLIDGRRLDAEKLGSDPDTDVALIRVKADNLTAIQFGDSTALEVGETVLAIGNPLLLGQTVTSGIVSGLHRSHVGMERYEDFIQTDAAIYPGNSGGALVNVRGELVGINTAFIGPAKGNPGLGFAIPSKMVRAIVDQILEYGEVRHGSLSITLQDSTTRVLDVAKQVTRRTGAMAQRNGAVIVKVDRQSTAEQAGLKPGDVVVEIDGVPVQNASHLRASLALMPIGEAAELAVLRDGRQIVIRAMVARTER
jgi:serine protease Do/serine protease DegQ